MIVRTEDVEVFLRVVYQDQCGPVSSACNGSGNRFHSITCPNGITTETARAGPPSHSSVFRMVSTWSIKMTISRLRSKSTLLCMSTTCTRCLIHRQRNQRKSPSNGNSEYHPDSFRFRDIIENHLPTSSQQLFPRPTNAESQSAINFSRKNPCHPFSQYSQKHSQSTCSLPWPYSPVPPTHRLLFVPSLESLHQLSFPRQTRCCPRCCPLRSRFCPRHHQGLRRIQLLMGIGLAV